MQKVYYVECPSCHREYYLQKMLYEAAVVNPDHIISLKYRAMLEQANREAIISPMPYYGEEMTVAELIDLVEFLHAQYTKLQPQYYRGYYLTK